MSRFDATLASAAASEQNHSRKWQLKLKLAVLCARRGDISAAREIIGEARGSFARSESAQIFAHINFAEGICDYFESGVRQSLVKLKRAKVLGAACTGDDDLSCLISAWLAAAYRSLGDWNLLYESLVEVFSAERELSDETLSRLALVVADSLLETEDYRRANDWYHKARRLAIRQGDDSTIGALLYNRSAIHVFNLRIAEIGGEGVDIDECLIALEAASAENYSLYVRDTSMRWAFDVLNGQLQMLRARYAEALEKLDAESVCGLESSWPAVHAVRVADVLRCKAGLSQIEVSDLETSVIGLSSKGLDVIGSGDSALVYHSLDTAFKLLGKPGAHDYHGRAMSALSRFRQAQQSEAAMIQRFFVTVASTPMFSRFDIVD